MACVAIAIVIAMFSVTLALWAGLIALAPLLVGARAIGRDRTERRRSVGILASLVSASRRRPRWSS